MITDHIRGWRFGKRLAQALDWLENLCRRVLRRSGLAPRGATLPATPPATEEIIRTRLRKLRVRNNLFAVERALFDLTAALLVAFLIWYVVGGGLFNAFCLTGAVGCFALLSLLRARRGWMRKNGAAALLDAELELKQRLVTFAEYAGVRVKPLLYKKLAADIVSELSDEKIRKIRRHRTPFSAYIAISIAVALLLNLLLIKIDPGIGYVLAEAGAGPTAGRPVEGALDGTPATGGAARSSAGVAGSVLGRLVEQLAMRYFPWGPGKRWAGEWVRDGARAADSSLSPAGSRKGSVAAGGYSSVSTSTRGPGREADRWSSGTLGGAPGGALSPQKDPGGGGTRDRGASLAAERRDEARVGLASSSRNTGSDGARGERRFSGYKRGEKAGKLSSRREPGDGGTCGKKASAGGKGGKGTKAAASRSGTGDKSGACDKKKGASACGLSTKYASGGGGGSGRKTGKANGTGARKGEKGVTSPAGGKAGSGGKTAARAVAGAGAGLGTDGDPPRGASAKGDDYRQGVSTPACDAPVDKDHWDRPGPLEGGVGAGGKPAEKKSDPSAPGAPSTEATKEMHLALEGMKRETARPSRRLTLLTGEPAEDSGEVARPSIGVSADARLSKEQAAEDAIDSAAIPAEYREIIKRIHLKDKGERKEYR